VIMQEIKEFLREIVGSKFVSDDLFDRWSYSVDSLIYDSIEPTPPAIVVRPGSIEEIQQILRVANTTRTPVYVRGGGTQCSGTRGDRVTTSVLIDMTRMNNIVEIDEESITVTAQAGMTWGKLNAELEKAGWRLGYKGPYSGYGSTVGGSVAYQSNGLGSTRYGVVGEEVTNLKVVLPDGGILQTGTAVNPNSKNYYRYCIGPDVAGIFIGSLGAFGVIAEVTLRMYPKADYSAFGSHAFGDYESAHKCYYDWLKNMVAEDVAWYAEDGLEVMVPELAEKGYKSMLTYVVEDVSSELVNARKNLLDQIAVDNKGALQDPIYAKAGWIYKFELLPRWVAKIGTWQWTCHLSSAGGSLRDLLEVLKFIDSYREKCEKHNVYSATISIAHKTCGHVSTSVYYDQSNPESIKLAKEMAEGIVKTAAECGGCNYKPGKLWYPYTIMKSPAYREVLAKLKKSLDPNNIMNPGALTLPLD